MFFLFYLSICDGDQIRGIGLLMSSSRDAMIEGELAFLVLSLFSFWSYFVLNGIVKCLTSSQIQ